MALVDPHYRFTYIDFGDYGSSADGAVFKTSEFGKAFLNNDLDAPKPASLPNYEASGPVPFCFVADEAFSLRADLMQPFPRGNKSLPDDEAIFNYRLSHARCIVENAFGILVQRFRVFAKQLLLIPDNVDRIVRHVVSFTIFFLTTTKIFINYINN